MSRAGRQIQLLLFAAQFLTRLPLPAPRGYAPDWAARAARYFPLVGQAVGAVSAAVFWAASLAWPAWIAALLALAAAILITGALHEDGLADAFDGLAGGATPARRLEIMKDSRVGTYGLLALVLTLGLKAAALASLPAGLGACVLIAAHGAARGAAVLAMTCLPYAGDPQASKWSPARPSWAEAGLALALSFWPLLLLPPPAAGWGLLLGAGLAAALALAAWRLIRGQTGDVLGGAEQMFETGFLLGAAIMVQY